MESNYLHIIIHMRGITTLQILDHKQGRFGNQLFRVATAIGQAQVHNCDYFIPAEWEHLHLFPALLKSAIPSAEITANIKTIFNENGFHYQHIPIHEGITEIRGYVQSEIYFEQAIEKVRNLLSFSVDKVDEIQRKYFNGNTQNLCIHVRHGDYYDRAVGGGHKGNEHYHPVMTLQYYENAINYVVTNREVKNIYIFTDHPETKEFIEGKFEKFGINIHYNDYSDDFTSDFIAQTLCDYYIIPNSTFSWWSAYLGNAQDKLICSPTKEAWFGPGYNHIIKDTLLPDSWVKINQ